MNKPLQILCSPYIFIDKYLWSKESRTCVNRNFHMVRILKRREICLFGIISAAFFASLAAAATFCNSSFLSDLIQRQRWDAASTL